MPAPREASAPAADRPWALLGCVIWSVGALKTAPVLPLAQNLQTLAGAVATLLVAVAWPSWHPRSYLRWRTAALGALRLFIFALPVNYNSATFDGLAPEPAVSRLACLQNASHLLMGTHVGLLIFCALIFRLPLRAHLRVHTACVGLLLLFGVRTHCASQLFTNPITHRMVAGLHGLMATMAALLIPTSSAIAPVSTEPYTQSAAALIFLWLLLGWLVPTVLLITPQPQLRTDQQADQQQDSWHESQRPRLAKRGAVALLERVEAAVESVIRLLLPPQQLTGAAARSTHARCSLSWLVAVKALWLASCGLALLYAPTT